MAYQNQKYSILSGLSRLVHQFLGGINDLSVVDPVVIYDPNTGLPAPSGSASDPQSVKDDTLAAIILATALQPPLQIRAQSILVIDLSSTVITATGSATAIPLDSGSSYGAVVNVTAVSGTTPTLDLFLQESLDGGVTWTDIYQVYRFTGAGTKTVPNQLLLGQRRWRYTLGGTSPSFTLSITGTRGTGSAPLIRNFYDYSTIDPNTLNATSPTWSVSGCRYGQLTVFNKTTTTPAVFQINYSADGTNFASAGSTVNPGANTVSTVNTVSVGSFVRVNVATAGSGQTNNYVNFYGTN